MENIGKTVRLIGGFPIDKYNPRNIEGKIVGLNPRMYSHNAKEPFGKYIVQWSNGIRNSYDIKHLEIL